MRFILFVGKFRKVSSIYSFKFFNGIILPTNGKIDPRNAKNSPLLNYFIY
jgi:hypothetical protein